MCSVECQYCGRVIAVRPGERQFNYIGDRLVSVRRGLELALSRLFDHVKDGCPRD